MKVIVFGATGTIGKLTVERLLDAGHHVTAFARSPGSLPLKHDRLTRVAGDAMQAAPVARAIQGHDAVVVTLGSGLSRKSLIRSQGTANVIRGMQKHGVRRLICQSTLGARESWDNLNFFWKRIMFGALLKPVFLDHELQERLVEVSGLEWTIVRPGAFTDKALCMNYKEDVAPDARNLLLKIARADVAAFLVRQLSDRRYEGRAVGITC